MPSPVRSAAAEPVLWEAVLWIVAAAAAGFAVAFAGTSLAALPRGWFVLLHVCVSGMVLAAYARRAPLGARDLIQHWPAGLIAGALGAAFSVTFVLSQPASAAPAGMALVWGLIWLGLVYGAVDALLLTVLPVHAISQAAHRRGWGTDWGGAAGSGLVALAASLFVTAAYHFGFAEFRGPSLVGPLIGNAVITLAYLLSRSPLAALLSHIALHVAAVLHAYGTSVPLPPHY